MDSEAVLQAIDENPRYKIRGGVRHPHNKCPGYDTKQSDGEVPVMLGLWGIRNTPSFPLLPGLLWPGGVAPDFVLPIVQI